MKTLFTAALLIACTSLVAQTNNPIQLRTGQKIEAKVENEMEADLGMGMLMKNNSETKSLIEVKGEKDDTYLLTNTLEKAKVKMEFMGQTQRYDSENEQDKDTEIGKQMSPLVGQPFNISLSKTSGKALAETKEENTDKRANPFQDILGGTVDGESAVSAAFFQLPKGKKKGDTWMITDSTAGGVSKHTYTLNNINGDMADFTFDSEMNIATPMESQGQEMIVTMTVKTKGTFTSDIVTGLVSKRTVETQMNGNIDVAGQTLPIMAAGTQVMKYEYE